ncbi:MAG: hypothetical protein COB36_02605 [Alphaproteobacteria bacterium]|nr:MAG: hypothetical protein COB36_02605 [Alphaproteobacteria bacterium]
MTINAKHYRKFITSLALLAMGLAFLAQITPLWVKTIDGQPIVICSAFGERTIFLDENGNKTPAPITIQNHCVMCLTAAADYTTPTTTKILGRHDVTAFKLHIPADQQTLRTRIVITAHTPRAPPRSTCV